MRLFLTDLSGQTLAVEAENVSALKTAAEAQGVAVETLTFNGQTLCEEVAFGDVEGLEEESTLFMNRDLLGGGKKRKKKTYTKPKKVKKPRKKVKLAILKCYKVDSNDKITRLRRECPHELCGPGVFMAKHADRYSCGRCHLTYLMKKNE